MDNFTTKDFWINYWKSKKDIIIDVPFKYPLSQEFEKIINKGNISTSIELGGFPGYYSVFLRKYYHINPTLLDYVIIPDIIKDLLVANRLSPDTINMIEADLFQYKTDKLYNLVFSVGLVEHFEDTEDLIHQHLKFLKEDGILMIALPNFRGINGTIQKLFDKKNYLAHNIKCMDVLYLKSICDRNKLKNIDINYKGKFSVWLENKDKKNLFSQIVVKLIWFIGKIIFKVINVESKIFSPYIVLTARK